MAVRQQSSFSTLFHTEQQCVSYLFHKRWPRGFLCPFCATRQQDTAPAHTVVCQHCRKQTSITAQTIMHRSRKSLVAWMLAAWLFCSQEEGLSARELQRLMGLGSYQTAWTWLQKIRLAAARAESVPCMGTVLIVSRPFAIGAADEQVNRFIALAAELNPADTQPRRLRLILHHDSSSSAIAALLSRSVNCHAVLLMHSPDHIEPEISNSYTLMEPTTTQLEIGEQIIRDLNVWLSTTYRNTMRGDYLQSYLNEFAFRCNTATWPDRLAVFDHLLTGLLSTDARSPARHTERS